MARVATLTVPLHMELRFTIGTGEPTHVGALTLAPGRPIHEQIADALRSIANDLTPPDDAMT